MKTVLTLTALLLAVVPTQAQDLATEAQQALSEQRWAEAADGFTQLVTTDAMNAAHWFGLATARHQLEQLNEAITAYGKAIELGYAPMPRARFQFARTLAKSGKHDEALSQLEEVAKTGGPNFRLVQSMPEFAPIASQARFLAVIDALRPCNTEQHRAFDFWLGDWDVQPVGAAAPTATNSITSVHDGCVVLEQYVAGNFTGMSLNFYDAARDRWHQTWSANNGGPLYIEGGSSESGVMVLSDRGLETATEGTINQITWTLLDDGRVRQHWQQSTDGEATWNTVFDGYYAKRSSSQ